ncbi:MAG: PSD1 and planctomycete cytochrome C domain-containing protein [Verrucomicrobiales bacterium]
MLTSSEASAFADERRPFPPMIRNKFTLAPLILALASAPGIAEEKFSEAEQLFTLKVAPMLSEKCNGCHGNDGKSKGGYDMLTRETLLTGGDEFGKESLVPGDAKKSFIMNAVRWDDPDWEMPPKENERLSKEQIADLETWIEAGAPWPSDEIQGAIRYAESHKKVTADGVIVDTSGGLGDEWTFRRYQPEDIWAFQPVVKPELPKTEISKTEATGPVHQTNPVDSFIEAKLAEQNFTLGEEAEPRKLLRRASYDLIGLPPTPDEIDTFLAAWEKTPEKAWSAEIDRLLTSPHYGERWGQHWLDVARYADTGGFSNDFERSNAWRYRDYVIRAFNEDKPYNQFVIEQIAGDELADASVRKRGEKVEEVRKKGNYTQEEAEWILATGFLRMGPWDDAMVPFEEARQLYLDDVVNAVGQTFLATTMRCFKCHDHKFDPLPTKDYYRMYSTFSGTWAAERDVPFLEEESNDGFAEGKAHVDKMWKFANLESTKILKKQEDAAKAWFKEAGLEYKNENARKSLDDEVKPPRDVGLNETEKGQKKVRMQDKWVWDRRKQRYDPMAQSVYNAGVKKPKAAGAKALRVDKNAPIEGEIESFIYTGGTHEAPGDKVGPGVVSALGVHVEGAPEDDPYILPEGIEGRRLELAKWIANPKNQLTTRSIVNRIWQGHFGQAISRNPNNFGVKGAKPTHPELLDWLAADFVENGWTMKRMHKVIMTSKAYRVGTKHDDLERLRTVDPDNKLLAYRTPRRLSAEEMRDSFLAATGELNEKTGGLFVKPEINMEVALQPRMIQFSLAPAYQPSPKPDDRNRRSIYAYRVRGLADPLLEIFNQPNPNDSCEMRDSAAVSPQVFTLLNSDMITDRSIAFAKRLKQEQSELNAQISEAFQLSLGRKPDANEVGRLTKYVAEMQAYHEKVSPLQETYPVQITRTLIEEFSGEPFDYEEILPAFENYIPDTKASDVDAETRALADLCVVLFNSNEFIYVY